MSECIPKVDIQGATQPTTSPQAFKAEVRTWANRLKVQPTAVHLRPMRRKWASCSALGRLTFDTGLLHHPPDFRTEVILHELLHLRIPNHGKLFRVTLAALLNEAAERPLTVSQP